jgi:serine/threonine protein kinase
MAGGAPVSTVMDSRLVGTPCYMDPEYLRTGRFGPKSDVYSLGEWCCMVWVCHTGGVQGGGKCCSIFWLSAVLYCAALCTCLLQRSLHAVLCFQQ